MESKGFTRSSTQSRRLSRPEDLTPKRVLIFDLENRPLAYWYDGATTAQITAIGWKWDDSEPRALLLGVDGWYQEGETKLSPEKTFEKFRQALTDADLIVGHNIRRHDLPILQAHLLRLQLPPLPPLLTCDTLKDYPKRKDLSASLENLAAMYGLEGDKFHMNQPAWEEANKLTPEGVEKARARVVSDVLLQEKLRNRLLELGILGPPRMWRPN